MHENELTAIRLSDRFYLLYKHLHTSLQSFWSTLEPLTIKKYIVKDSFNFTAEIINKDFSNLIGSFDRDPLESFKKKPLKFAPENFLKTATLFIVLKKVNLKIFYQWHRKSHILTFIINYINELRVAIRALTSSCIFGLT